VRNLWQIAIVGKVWLVVVVLWALNGPFNHGQFQDAYANWPSSGKADLTSRFATWDVAHYLILSQRGYQAGSHSCAFYPLWPMLLREATVARGVGKWSRKVRKCREKSGFWASQPVAGVVEWVHLGTVSVSVSVQEERQTVQDMNDLRRRIEHVPAVRFARVGGVWAVSVARLGDRCWSGRAVDGLAREVYGGPLGRLWKSCLVGVRGAGADRAALYLLAWLVKPTGMSRRASPVLPTPSPETEALYS